MNTKLMLLALLTLPTLAGAEPSAAPPRVASAPAPAVDPAAPPTIGEDTGPEPEVRIVQKGDNKIEEYRINGRLYMVKVTPSIGAPYYLMDEDGSGKLRTVDPSQRVIIPRWVLLRF
jgi:hypothetical protein